jgi:hypothetical protein
VLHHGAGHHLELLAAEMTRAADAPGAEAELVRIGLGRGREVGHGLEPGIGRHRHQEGRAEQGRHRLEGLQRLEAAALVQVRQGGQVLAVQLEQRVAIGGSRLVASMR